jgi:hypothetical protein
MHKMMQLISNFLYQKNHASFYVITCSLGQVDENLNHMKISNSWNFETKGFNGTNSFIKLFN